MPNCAVKLCKNTSKNLKVKSRDVTFHIFPKDNKIKEIWIDAVDRENWFPSPRTTICSEHFEETCFDLSKKRRYLLPNAIPTLKLDLDENKTEEPMQIEAFSTDVPCTIVDTPCKKKLRSRIMYLECISQQRLLKIKRLQTNQRRLKRKIHRMEEELQELKKKNLLCSQR